MTIILGDCFDIMSGFNDGHFKGIITDPPYQYLDHKLDKKFDEKLFVSECYRLIDNGFFVFFGRGESFYRMGYFASEIGFKFCEEIVWDKRRISSPVTCIARHHETLAIFKKGKARLNKIKIDPTPYYSHWDGDRVASMVKKS